MIMDKNIQQYFFEIVKSKISGNHSCPAEVGGLLDISMSSAYRKIRGETKITFKELRILCNHFSISMDEILNYSPQKGIFFQFADSAIWENNRTRYIHYIENLYETLADHLSSTANGELFCTACDIPIYHLVNFPELLFFKFYSEHIPDISDISYSYFCSQLDKDAIVKSCEQITKAYMQIPSKEIWTYRTIEPMLQSIEYYEDTVSLDKKTASLLLDQLLELIDTIKKYADTGSKRNGKTPFYMYLCPVDIKHDLILFSQNGKLTCAIALFINNNAVSNDMPVCDMAEKWINGLISKSVLVKGTSGKERRHFFHTLTDRINSVKNSIS
jgi:hypothetical protein